MDCRCKSGYRGINNEILYRKFEKQISRYVSKANELVAWAFDQSDSFSTPARERSCYNGRRAFIYRWNTKGIARRFLIELHIILILENSFYIYLVFYQFAKMVKRCRKFSPLFFQNICSSALWPNWVYFRTLYFNILSCPPSLLFFRWCSKMFSPNAHAITRGYASAVVPVFACRWPVPDENGELEIICPPEPGLCLCSWLTGFESFKFPISLHFRCASILTI